MLRPFVKSLSTWLAALTLCTGAQAASREYLQALEKELDNRAVANAVTPMLAERYRGSEQGRFWTAYAALEAKQHARYQQQAMRYGLSTQGRGSILKVQGSRLFSWLFNEAFINKLAAATQAYLIELKAVEPPKDADSQAFWAYVIAQETAQVEALALASQQQFNQAAARLESFVQQ